jgi:hypothetical protein
MTDLAPVAWFSAAFRGAGLYVEMNRSRRSRSAYLYIYRSEHDRTEGDAVPVSLRISNHPNPASNPWRVSDIWDRAEETDYEWRTDLGQGFTREPRYTSSPDQTSYRSWRELAVAIMAGFQIKPPARMKRDMARIAAKQQAEAEAREAAYAEMKQRAEIQRAASQALDAAARILCEADGHDWDKPGKKGSERRGRYRKMVRVQQAAKMEQRAQ